MTDLYLKKLKPKTTPYCMLSRKNLVRGSSTPASVMGNCMYVLVCKISPFGNFTCYGVVTSCTGRSSDCTNAELIKLELAPESNKN